MGRECYRIAFVSFAFTLSVGNGASSFAQLPPLPSISCQMGAPAGARRYQAGEWCLVEFSAINRTDKPAEVQAVLRFVDDPTIHFSRRAWLLPNSVLRSTCPVRVPDVMPAGTRHVEFLTAQILPPKETGPGGGLTPQDAMARAQPMLLTQENPSIGMIADLAQKPPPENKHPIYVSYPPRWTEPDNPCYEMILAAKRARNMSRRVSCLDPGNLPPGIAALDVLDVLVLSSNRLTTDPAGIVSVRDWVLGGGLLWITLDDVQPELLWSVMGDAFACTVVDRVDLTSVAIHNIDRDAPGAVVEQQEFDEPVRFVRVLAEGVNVTHTVDGWPAAFWQPFGDGRVYFTTLGPAAWMRPEAPDDPPPQNPEDDTPFVARSALGYLADDCLFPRPAPRLEASQLQPFLTQQIGYRILGRGTVAALLSAFFALLVLVGWRLFRAGRSDRLTWAAPLAATVFGLIFLALGTATKRAVPPTAATIGRIAFEPGVGVGHAAGLIAWYNQDANRERLGAQHGGIFYPDMTAMSGRIRRITWTDEGAWHWEDLELPAGVRTAPFQQALTLDNAVNCRARFGPDGLSGRLDHLPLRGAEDAVIAIPHQNALAVSVDDDGSFRTGPEDVLATGEFLSESVFSDEQVRRQSVYRELLESRRELESSPRPVLHAWTHAADTGFVFPQANRLDAALFSIPLRLERTPAGTQVRIPAPFLPYCAVIGPDGQLPTAYANVTREWVQSTLPQRQWLRFQVPPTVLPLELSQATVSISVRAPSRIVELLMLSGNEERVVLQLTHPIGTYQRTLEPPDLPQLDEDGGLRLAVRVGQDAASESKDQMTQAFWKIEQLQMHVTGTVQGE